LTRPSPHRPLEAEAALLAIVVYTVGKLIERAWIEPVLDVRKMIGEIAFSLTCYPNVSGTGAHVFAESGREAQGQMILDEAHAGRKALREHAGHLQSRAYSESRQWTRRRGSGSMRGGATSGIPRGTHGRRAVSVAMSGVFSPGFLGAAAYAR
jgi:hypothetical protein